MPFSSPTTTSAVNEKRRPPLTTLATRLISSTRSCKSSPCGLTVSMSGFVFKASKHRSDLETQPALAGALGERTHAPVVLVAAAVEHAGLHPRLLRPPGQDLAGLLRLLHRTELLELGLRPRHRHDGPLGIVVDELREH